MSKTRTNEHRDPQKLKNHPLNIKLYKGAPPTADFVASVKAHGILTPLLITTDDVVISGHDRKNAARMAGLKEVPVVVLRDVTDPLDQEELLIVSNRQKQKDNETLAREAARLTEIESERAAERVRAAQSKPGSKAGTNAHRPKNSEDIDDSGRTRERVAEALGVGEQTAVKLAEAGRELKKAEESGDAEKADSIKRGLQKSVSAGHKAATSANRDEDKPTPFDEPLAGVDWVLKTAVPKIQEYAIDAEKAIGSGKGAFSQERVSKLVKPIHEAFQGIRGVIANAQQKARRK